MAVRLGFAVAIYTEPDLLLVDAALAVGDAAFQRKCLHSIQQYRDRGTLFLVSHDLDAVQERDLPACHLAGGWRGPCRRRTDRRRDGLPQPCGADRAGEGLPRRNPPPQRSKTAAGERARCASPPWNCWTQTGKRLKSTGVAQRPLREVSSRSPTPSSASPSTTTTAHTSPGPTPVSAAGDPAAGACGQPHLYDSRTAAAEGQYVISRAAVDSGDGETYDYHDRRYLFQVFPGQANERYGLISLGGELYPASSRVRPIPCSKRAVPKPPRNPQLAAPCKRTPAR